MRYAGRGSGNVGRKRLGTWRPGPSVVRLSYRCAVNPSFLVSAHCASGIFGRWSKLPFTPRLATANYFSADILKARHPAPSGSPRDWLTCSQLLEHHTHIPYHVDKPYIIDTKYRRWVHSLHCVHISTIEATCSGQQADDILFSPAENRSERTRPSCDEGRTGLANTMGKWEAKLRLKKLFDVWPTDILRLFNLHNAKNLQGIMIRA